MNQSNPEGGLRGKNYSDAVILALEYTDDYQLAYQWLEAFSSVAGELHPHIESEVRDIVNYFDEAIHVHDPDIHQKMWDERPMKGIWRIY